MIVHDSNIKGSSEKVHIFVLPLQIFGEFKFILNKKFKIFNDGRVGVKCH